jgi:hypothetical protein
MEKGGWVYIMADRYRGGMSWICDQRTIRLRTGFGLLRTQAANQMFSLRSLPDSLLPRTNPKHWICPVTKIIDG